MTLPEHPAQCADIHAWEFVGFKNHVFHRLAEFHPEVADYESVYKCQRCGSIDFGCNITNKQEIV